MEFSDTDYWRAVILYGLNTATYKIGLAECLANFVRDGQTSVPLRSLATAFLDRYQERLRGGKPQLVTPGRLTAMERIVALHQHGRLDREQAIETVARDAFGDVIPRFHVVNGAPLPVRFYDDTTDGLVLTDNAFRVFTSSESGILRAELASRWDLLEAAFEMRRSEGALVNDVRQFYLSRGYQRTDITQTRPVLNGYQNGVCFYCGEVMPEGDVHVDHVIPRQLVCHDEIWNLVLAHGFCNEQKTDSLPGPEYVEKLLVRNEHFISSNWTLAFLEEGR
jgi:hypothetical protein